MLEMSCPTPCLPEASMRALEEANRLFERPTLPAPGDFDPKFPSATLNDLALGMGIDLR